MSYVIGEPVQTQKGKALCMGFKDGEKTAIFELADSEQFDLPNIERKVKKKKYVSQSASKPVQPTLKEKVETLDKTIEEAQAKLAELKKKTN